MRFLGVDFGFGRLSQRRAIMKNPMVVFLCVLSIFSGALVDRMLMGRSPNVSSDTTRVWAHASMLRAARNALNEGNNEGAKFLITDLFQDDIQVIRKLRGLSGRELSVQQKLLNEVGR